MSSAPAEEPAAGEAARSGPPRWARLLTAGSLAVAVIALVFTIRDVGLYTLGKYLKLIGPWWLAIVPMEVLSTTLHATASTKPDHCSD